MEQPKEGQVQCTIASRKQNISPIVVYCYPATKNPARRGGQGFSVEQAFVRAPA